MKGAKNKTQNKNVVGNGSANVDASIEEMEKNAAAAAGLVEGPEAVNGTAGEESKSPAASPPSAAPAEGEDEPDPLAALLAAQDVPATVSDVVQHSAGEQAVPQGGAEVASTCGGAGASDRTGADRPAQQCVQCRRRQARCRGRAGEAAGERRSNGLRPGCVV